MKDKKITVLVVPCFDLPGTRLPVVIGIPRRKRPLLLCRHCIEPEDDRTIFSIARELMWLPREGALYHLIGVSGIRIHMRGRELNIFVCWVDDDYVYKHADDLAWVGLDTAAGMISSPPHLAALCRLLEHVFMRQAFRENDAKQTSALTSKKKS